MLKLVRETAHNHVTQQTHQFEGRAYLPHSEQMETIQNHAKLKETVKEVQHSVQTVTLSEITPSDTTPGIYPSLRDFENTPIQNQQDFDNALQ